MTDSEDGVQEARRVQHRARGHGGGGLYGASSGRIWQDVRDLLTLGWDVRFLAASDARHANLRGLH